MCVGSWNSWPMSVAISGRPFYIFITTERFTHLYCSPHLECQMALLSLGNLVHIEIVQRASHIDVIPGLHDSSIILVQNTVGTQFE